MSEKLQSGVVDWQDAHAGQYIFEDQCWTTCNGGFCCSNNHPDFQFQLIPTHGTTLLYMWSEYQWLDRTGKVPEKHHHGQPPQELSLDFGGPEPLRIVQTPCRLLGQCEGVIDKPLLCKLYPVLPVLDDEGELEDVIVGSIFDATFDAMGWSTPCTVFGKRATYLKHWQANRALLDGLRHPYIIFHLQAAALFLRNYTAKLIVHKPLKDRTGADFWKNWELQYLSGRLVDGETLRRDIAICYARLAARYGAFLQAEEGLYT